VISSSSPLGETCEDPACARVASGLVSTGHRHWSSYYRLRDRREIRYEQWWQLASAPQGKSLPEIPAIIAR
jgi:hypothetical protein